MKNKIFILCCICAPLVMRAQLTVQRGAGMYLQKNSELIVQNDLVINEFIEGDGSIILNGGALQTINTHNNQISNLSIDNANGVILSSALKINGSISIIKGHLSLNKYDLELGRDAMASGNASAYILTGGEGRIVKSVRRNLEGFILPVGTKNSYTPLILRSSGKYQNASIAVGAKDKASPNKPQCSKDYLDNYWTITRSGINGDVTATAFYNKLSGNESNLEPYYWNGSSWKNKDMPVDTKNKLLSISVPEGSGEIFAMRKGDELTPASSSMTLLPNPVRNTATLIIRTNENSNAVIRFTDNAGNGVITQRVILRKGVNQVNINVMYLSDGHYIISSTQKNSLPVKMIKQ